VSNLTQTLPLDVFKHTYNFFISKESDAKEISNLSLINECSHKAITQLFQEYWTDLRLWVAENSHHSKAALLMCSLMDRVEPESESKKEDSIFHNKPQLLLIKLRRLFNENCDNVPRTFLLTPNNIQESLGNIQANNDIALCVLWPKINEILPPAVKLDGSPSATQIRSHINALSQEQLKFIEKTDLDGHGLGLKVIPIEIAKFPFTLLDLSGNKISKIPGFLSKMPLQWLDLSDNQISEIPDDLSQMTDLRNLATDLMTLDLSDNQISEIPDSLSQMTGLTSLILRGNPILKIPKFLFHLAYCDLLIPNPFET
jgi:Leucine-rich repeat (LRR) protein